MEIPSSDEQALKVSTHSDSSTWTGFSKGVVEVEDKEEEEAEVRIQKAKAEDVTIITQPILIQNLTSLISNVNAVMSMATTSLNAIKNCMSTREKSLIL